MSIHALGSIALQMFRKFACVRVSHQSLPFKLSSITRQAFNWNRSEIGIRYFSTKIIAPIDRSEFFNREREIEAFKNIFKSSPQLSIVSGPVNSGKTSLLLKVLKEVSEQDKQPVLHLDLRERSFSSVDEFQSVLSDELSSWVDSIENQSRDLSIGVEGFGVKFSATKSEAEMKTPIHQLNHLFQLVSKKLPTQDWWRGKRVPVLFIDEASRLNALLRDPDGHEALVNLFEWFVKSTKQSFQFHIVLSSSNSFFHLWVTKFVGASRFKSYVVGDLDRNEAKRYWDEKLVVKLSQADLQKPNFEKAYSVCGGSMFLLNNYVKDFIVAKGNFEPHNFFLVRQERTRLINALWRDMGTIEHLTTKDVDPAWNRENLYHLMEMLTKSPNRFLDYEQLCSLLTKKVVDSCINHNIIHLRPTNEFAWDIPNAPIGKAIVTAETPSAVVAMQQLLEEKKKEYVASGKS